MIRKYLLPILALAGIVLGIAVAIQGAKQVTPAAPVSQPAHSPYRIFVAGSGLIEASSENIAIGTTVGGVVARIYVQIGSQVKAGEPLFTLDDRTHRAEIALRENAVKVVEAQLADARDELAFNEGLSNTGAVSVEDTNKRRNTVRVVEAQLAQTKAQLSSAMTELEKLTVRAPVDGQVLQLKVHLGEYAPAGILGTPLIMLGNVTPLHVRVDVDEDDAWRIRSGAAATACLRGNKDISTPLKFVRFEPYVLPKRSLTGDSTERVDTRVLQVIFSFTRGDLPLFVGQQMDVFIDAPTRSFSAAPDKAAKEAAP
ncbi:efflux RND transporter periplasmic adaptor subunit [Prosthecobacter sp.]|uniref:efflux RND transporter periplasmic adaptor subunit n=1 Tax=Prosthecobacter sp. TaxID=1965333 RepID=UPI0037844182